MNEPVSFAGKTRKINGVQTLVLTINTVKLDMNFAVSAKAVNTTIIELIKTLRGEALLIELPNVTEADQAGIKILIDIVRIFQRSHPGAPAYAKLEGRPQEVRLAFDLTQCSRLLPEPLHTRTTTRPGNGKTAKIK